MSEIKAQDPFANLIARPWEVPELNMEEEGGLFVESIVHTITDNLKDGNSKEKKVETLNNGDKKTTEYVFSSNPSNTIDSNNNNMIPGFEASGIIDNTNNSFYVPYNYNRDEQESIDALKSEIAYNAGKDWLNAVRQGVAEDFGGDSISSNLPINLVHSQQDRLAKQEDPYSDSTLYPGNEDASFDSNTVYNMGVSDDGSFVYSNISSIEPADFDEDGNLTKFPKITTEDGDTKESSNLPNYNDPANDPEAEAQIEIIAADKTHNSATALKTLQEELNNHKFSPQLMAQDYKQFLEEAGYIKDVDEQLYKSLIGVASALVMGYDVGEAITYGFGAQVEAQRLAKEEQDAKNDQMMDLLKEYGPNMTDDMWNASIAELGANTNDPALKFLTMGREATRKTENAAAELSYVEEIYKLEKELFNLIHREGDNNNTIEAAEFTDMFYAVADQMEISRKPGESLDTVLSKMKLAKSRLIGAYGQWENYSKNIAGKPSSERSAWKPWTWFKEKLPEITTPMVFFEGMHGLIDGGGANIIPLDPENKPEQYAKSTLALYFLDGLEKDFQKKQEIQKDIFNKWSKEEKGKGGSFDSIDNYPDYFYAEIYKMINERNKQILSQ